MSLDVWLEREVTRIESVFEWNITHNLARMAIEAGIYQHLWRPDELGIATAGDLIEPLREGLAKLNADPDHYRAFNPENGWGDYDGLVNFVRMYLHACEENQSATVRVSR